MAQRVFPVVPSFWASPTEYTRSRQLDALQERLDNENRCVDLLEQFAALQNRKRQAVQKLAGRLTTPGR